MDLRNKKEIQLGSEECRFLINTRCKYFYGYPVKYFDNVFSMMKGLMFEKEKVIGVFRRDKEVRVDVHTFFVRYPIRIYLLDKSFRLVESFVMKPYRWRMPKNKYKYMIEVPVEEVEV